MDFETTLLNQNEIIINKKGKNMFETNFSIENKNLIIPKILDFSLIKLICELNQDIYESINIDTIDENNVIILLTVKHLFEDLGISQKYFHLQVEKTYENNKIIFKSQTLKNKPTNISEDIELVDVKNFNIYCNIITPNKVDFTITIMFDQSMVIPSYFDKMIGSFLNKIFNRVKQFIEKITI